MPNPNLKETAFGRAIGAINIASDDQTVDVVSLWKKVIEKLDSELTATAFNTWILPLKPLEIDENYFVLVTPDDTSKQTIEHRYVPHIRSAIREIIHADYKIRLVIKGALTKTGNSIDGMRKEKSNNTLQPKYLFETFVKGKSNELAFAASVAVAESPGTMYNPLFLYGGVGLGKTHLMHSIGNYILELAPDTKVLYTSAENLMNEFITSLKERKNQEFRDKYRNVDVLLVDDIQFLSDKEGTQEEFFHTFNALYFANKQIVISSDKPPIELKTLEDRLRSRFGSGLIVDITMPDLETRIAILEKKVELDHILVPQNVIYLIAKSISSNIRELEGALNKVMAYAKLTNTAITVEVAEKALRDMIDGNANREINVAFIQEIVANYYGLTPDEIRSKKRTANITSARHIAMYLSRMILDQPLIKIGQEFGGRDHSTVIHACDKISEELDNNEVLQRSISDLEKKIKGEA